MKKNGSYNLLDREYVLKLTAKANSLEKLRSLAMPVIREAYQHARDNIRQRFLVSSNGTYYVSEHAAIMDDVISILNDLAQTHIQPHKIALVAAGGYGRKELFPYSDIDLLLLHGKKDKHDNEFVEWLMYCLWDLGLNIGQAIRTPSETIAIAKQNLSAKTGLLDVRFICGDKALFKKF